MDSVPYKWAAQKLIPVLKKNPNAGMDALIAELKKYKVLPAYHQVYRAKQKAIRLIKDEQGGPTESAPPKAVSNKRKRNDGAKVLPNRCSNCFEKGKTYTVLNLHIYTTLLIYT